MAIVTCHNCGYDLDDLARCPKCGAENPHPVTYESGTRCSICDLTNVEVSRANVKYHAAMADSYDRDQPHFKPENQEQVKIKLLALGSRFGFDRLLDVGCGTGFVTRHAQRYYKETVGVDVTRKMLHLAPGSASLILGDAYHLPFPSERFDVVTAYSVLHHLQNIEAVASEAYRVLKSHGCFWSALDPNAHFFYYAKTVTNLSAIQLDKPQNLKPVLEWEIRSVSEVETVLRERYGLEKEVVDLAEFHKMREGLNPLALEAIFRRAGFFSVDVRFDWFLGQGRVLHEKGEDAVDAIDGWLREVLPLSAPLYKYLEVTAVKL